MVVGTGQTLYEIVQSFDNDNNPITGVTFDQAFYIDGQLTTGITLSISLSNSSIASYSVSWSASTYGYHQYYLKNDLTDVIFVSDVYDVVPDSQINASPTIYVGL